MRADVGALGIDVEPAECLPSELLDLVATPQERLNLGDDVYRGRLLFVAKEAVYKASIRWTKRSSNITMSKSICPNAKP
jgi:Phosphopantetheinyl transferase component of siderophore synthetase